MSSFQKNVTSTRPKRETFIMVCGKLSAVEANLLESANWFFHHDNTSHRALLVQDNQTKNGIMMVLLSLYSSNLVLTNYYLCPRMKVLLKGCRSERGYNGST
jgi:hypothetical protein